MHSKQECEHILSFYAASSPGVGYEPAVGYWRRDQAFYASARSLLGSYTRQGGGASTSLWPDVETLLEHHTFSDHLLTQI